MFLKAHGSYTSWSYTDWPLHGTRNNWLHILHWIILHCFLCWFNRLLLLFNKGTLSWPNDQGPYSWNISRTSCLLACILMHWISKQLRLARFYEYGRVALIVRSISWLLTLLNRPNIFRAKSVCCKEKRVIYYKSQNKKCRRSPRQQQETGTHVDCSLVARTCSVCKQRSLDVTRALIGWRCNVKLKLVSMKTGLTNANSNSSL